MRQITTGAAAMAKVSGAMSRQSSRARLDEEREGNESLLRHLFVQQHIGPIDMAGEPASQGNVERL